MSINFFNAIYKNAINGTILRDGNYALKYGIYDNSTMKAESGIDDDSLNGEYYTATSSDSINWIYTIGVSPDHATLSNLDFEDSGHIGFAGLEVSNTFTQENIFSNKISTNLIQSIDTSDIYIQGSTGVYLGTKGQDSANSTLYINGEVESRSILNMTDHKITNLANPVDSKDGVNLQYLTSIISGLYPDAYKVMLSGSDTAGYLNTKLLQGNGILFDTTTETITVNANIQNTTVGGFNLFKDGYTAKQLINGDYMLITEDDNSITLAFDYSNFSMTTIWQDAVLDFAILDDIDTTSFVGGERYINTSANGGYVVNSIYTWNSEWVETIVETGFATWVNDEDVSSDLGYWSFNGTEWVRFGGSLSHNTLSNKDGGDADVFYHLSDSERVSILTGVNTTLHYHTALRDSLNDTVVYCDAGIFYTKDIIVEGAETSITLKDTNTGVGVVLSNADSVLNVDKQIKAEGIDFNNNKGVNCDYPTEDLDIVNLATLKNAIGTTISKIQYSVVANTTKTLESVPYTTGASFKYMYSIKDADGNRKSGEINLLGDDTDVNSTEYAILELGSTTDLNEYDLSVVNNTVTNEIELILTNTNLTLDVDVTVIRINIEID